MLRAPSCSHQDVTRHIWFEEFHEHVKAEDFLWHIRVSVRALGRLEAHSGFHPRVCARGPASVSVSPSPRRCEVRLS